MEFVPISAAWEITMACNMRCRHCGSGCTDRRPDELTTEEALRLCDDLAEIGVKFVGLSGGEPLLRHDWPLIARRLTGHGIVVSMVSNGWLIDERVIDKAFSAGLDTIGVSLDGLKETHDAIRRKGAFTKVLNALLLMKEKGFPSSVITTVMKQNLLELPELKKILEKRGVEQWQIQMGIPMGSLQHNLDDVIDPFQLNDIIDFAHDVMKEGKISMLLANSIGYYTDKSVKTREAALGPGTAWSGCYAGKSSLGILHDGRIVGCFFLKDDEFVEGSIRETSLREIWSRHGAFAWNREMNREKLTGFCRKCRYSDRCLGGCSTLKHFTGGTLSENTYCAFRTSMEQLIPKINRIQDAKTLVARAEKSMSMKLYEVAEMCLCRAIEISPADIDILNKLGDVYFQLRDYEQILEMNQNIQADNPYSLKGLDDHTLSQLEKREECVALLKKSDTFSNGKFMDPYHDLAAVLHDLGRLEEAIEVLEQGSRKSSSFAQQTKEMYQSFLREKNGKEVITDDWKKEFVHGRAGEIPAHLPTM